MKFPETNDARGGYEVRKYSVETGAEREVGPSADWRVNGVGFL